MGKGRKSKLSKSENDFVCCVIYENSEHVDGVMKLSISNRAMAEMINELLQEKGSDGSVNEKYIERIRKSLGIEPFGVRGRKSKFNEEQIEIIHNIILNHTDHQEKSKEFWHLKMSDVAMADLLIEQGFDVNTKYVERLRNSIGINPYGKKGPEASRPSIASTQIALLHEMCVNQLSYHQKSSGALLGQSGMDVNDRFGHHTLSYEEAIARKNVAIQSKPRSSVKTATNYYSDNNTDTYNIEDFISRMGLNELLKGYSPQPREKDIFNAEVEKRSSLYGKVGKGGGTHNNKTAQTYSSI